ncbi:MAG: hypothetical protein AAF478_07040 [Pseudomonadota bacterium]
MMIARWTVEARFGQKNQAIELLQEWYQEIGSQTDIDLTSKRILTGSVGAGEAVIETEFEIGGLGDLQDFYNKIGSIKMHADWGPKMGEVVVSGSAVWQVYRVID